MHRTTNAFSVLQATAATVAIAIVIWSIGVPAFRFAEAANVTNFSNILSDSTPDAPSNHTIEFTTPTGVLNGGTIVITFDPAFDTSGVSFADIDVAATSNFTVAADCSGTEQVGASFAADVLTLTLCAGDSGVVAPADTVTIEIGTNATGGTQQILNPNATGSYVIQVAAGAEDSGETQVAIVDSVQVTASVDTLFTFTVDGLGGGANVNGVTTSGTSTAVEIPFGTLEATVASTAAQELSVVTNARNGFVVTVVTDQQLSSSNGAVIDSFTNGSDELSPISWESPDNIPGQPVTYGHWGITSDDNEYFPAASSFRSILTTPVEIFAHDGPVNGSGTGAGTTRIGFRVEIGSLQEAANDYRATLTYVATPVF